MEEQKNQNSETPKGVGVETVVIKNERELTDHYNSEESQEWLNASLGRPQANGAAADSLKIIYKNNKPHGIRNKNGYLLFFPSIFKYEGQEERYRQEVEEQYRLADYLMDALRFF